VGQERSVAVKEVEVESKGWGRRRCGRGFIFLDERGQRISDPDVVGRLKALAIPPAWVDVWICPDPCGHIQAVGVDDRGRRQYRYHDEWRVQRNRAKHDRMLELAQALPRLRRRLRRDLGAHGMGRDRVLAAAVRLLQLGLFRVGGEEYADENGSYGLATVRKHHVQVRDGEARFDYPAKGQQQRVLVVRDPEVVEIVETLKRRRGGGAELLAFKDDRGHWVDVQAGDINAYLQDALGSDFSAKDFRTWTATVLAAVALAAEEDPESDRQRKKAVVQAVRDVARLLGNTPAVARSSYVDPRVIEHFEDGRTVGDLLDSRDLERIVEELRPTDADGASGDTEDDVVALDAIPERLLAEANAAVVELLER
jgi:DNA topoisomerase I